MSERNAAEYYAVVGLKYCAQDPSARWAFRDDGFPGKCLDFRLGFRHADNYGASVREFFVGDFGDELQVQAETPAFLICRVVKEINDVATKSIFGAAAFIEIEGAGGIHFQVGCISQDGTELALEVECSLAHFRHGESHYVVGHRSRRASQEDARSVQCGLSAICPGEESGGKKLVGPNSRRDMRG